MVSFCNRQIVTNRAKTYATLAIRYRAYSKHAEAILNDYAR